MARVGQRLSLDRSHDAPVDDRVVTSRQLGAACGRLLVAERPWVPLVNVDDDLQLLTRRSGRRDRDVGTSLASGPRRLPEDDVTAAGLREHELRTVLPGPIEHEIDGRATPATVAHRHPLHDVGVFGPLEGAVAVHLRRPRPHVAHLQHDRTVRQRQPHQIRQRGTLLRVPGHDELPHVRHPPASRSGVCRASASKSASAWSSSTSARIATAAMRQSTSLRTVSPLRRHVRYHVAAPRSPSARSGWMRRGEQTPQFVEMSFVASAGENLHAHRIARRHVGVEQRVDVLGTPGSRYLAGTPPTPTCRRGSRHARGPHVVEVALPARPPHAHARHRHPSVPTPATATRSSPPPAWSPGGSAASRRRTPPHRCRCWWRHTPTIHQGRWRSARLITCAVNARRASPARSAACRWLQVMAGRAPSLAAAATGRAPDGAADGRA